MVLELGEQQAGAGHAVLRRTAWDRAGWRRRSRRRRRGCRAHAPSHRRCATLTALPSASFTRPENHGVQAQIQGHRGEDRHQDGRHHRDGGEPGDQPHMQPRAGAARSARRPTAAPAARRSARASVRTKREIDQQQARSARCGRGVRRQARQQRVGDAAGQHRQQRRRQRRAATAGTPRADWCAALGTSFR